MSDEFRALGQALGVMHSNVVLAAGRPSGKTLSLLCTANQHLTSRAVSQVLAQARSQAKARGAGKRQVAVAVCGPLGLIDDVTVRPIALVEVR